jgi:ATP-dependent protease Clp ATPase subunit
MNESEPICSFCRQPKSKVVKLIAGEGQVAICNYCVALCYDVLRREGVNMTLQGHPPGNENETQTPG